MTARYDRIGSTYAAHRQPDPRVSSLIEAALGDATTVLDVGGGTGSYELGGRHDVALEPSRVMLDQRPADAAPAVQGVAEHLPFVDAAFDAAMAILTVHHWPDAAAGLAEVRRVTTYLEPGVRAAISGLALLDPAVIDRMVAELAADLDSGRWHERHADLLEQDTYDAGYRLVIADPA